MRTTPEGHKNLFVSKTPELQRRHIFSEQIKLIGDKILDLVWDKFTADITTAECIEALITMTGATKLLEVGCCTGFTTLHMLRAIYGKPGATVTTIDPALALEFDEEFFARPEISQQLTIVRDWAPQCFTQFEGQEPFDFAFVDSDHRLDHTIKEFEGLMKITRPGSVLLYHDVPAHQSPGNHTPHPVNSWLGEKVREGVLRGTCFPSCRQLDGLAVWGENYDLRLSPGLGVFLRN